MTFGSDITECQGLTDLTLPQTLHQPAKITEEIVQIQSSRDTLLPQLKIKFVAFKQNENDDELENAYEAIKTQLTNLNAQIYLISGKIDLSSEEINKRLLCLNKLIIEEKKINQNLKFRLGKTEKEKNAANEMIYDYKNIYEKGYLRNWGLFLSIILVIILTKKIFPNKKIV